MNEAQAIHGGDAPDKGQEKDDDEKTVVVDHQIAKLTNKMGNNTISSDFKKAPKESRTEVLAAQSPTALDDEA